MWHTAAVAARWAWAAKPLATASSLIAYTVTSLAFVVFRLYLAALRAHDLIDDSKKPSSSRPMRVGLSGVWMGCFPRRREGRA